MTELPLTPPPRKGPKQRLKRDRSSLSCKEVQKHSSGAATEASWYEEPRHFILFLCLAGFCSQGHLLIHYSSLNGNHCIHVPESTGKEKDTSPPLKYTFSSCTRHFHLYPIGQNVITWSLFQMVLCLAKMRGSITKEEEENRGSLKSLMVVFSFFKLENSIR